MKRAMIVLAMGTFVIPLVHASDAGLTAPEHESRTMLYFTVPIGATGRDRAAPAVGLRLERAATTSYVDAGLTLAERRAVPLMDVRLSMRPQRDIRLNGIPLWTEGASDGSAPDGGAARETAPSRPFWKRPAFWIVTGTVVTVTVVAAELSGGYNRLNHSTAPQGAGPH
jgi:hypothetical protein